MRNLKQKGFYYILLAAAAVLILVTAIMGATQKAMTKSVGFSIPLIISLAAGVAVVVIDAFTSFDPLPLIASALFSVGFGLILYEGLPVVVDKINDISYQGGNFSLVMTYLVIAFIACVISFAACFLKKNEN